ncbi:vancomycin resistance histidine kinase VanS [Eubacteriales bacterium OttesenSCG-928-M02]|nr:vancomycin resistance histidine kinase VanS [Eubacteriales bacterium OttesenSCG-928-M02]
MKPSYLSAYRRYTLLRLAVMSGVIALVCAFVLYVLDTTFNGVFVNIIYTFSPSLARFIVQERALFLLVFYSIILAMLVLVTAIRYTYELDQVVASIDQVFLRDNASIHLPRRLKDVEDKLNAVKFDMIRNEQLAQEAEQRKNDLVVYLAHDLKTPLTSIIGYLTLLKEEAAITPEMQERFVDISLDKAQRLEELINEFFDITRFSLQSITLNKVPLNLSLMLEQLVDEFYPIFATKDLTCRLQLSPGLIIQADGDKLARVFDNVLRNAINYSYEGTEIGIYGVQSRNRVFLSFQNVGAPIPPENLEQIFDKFFRVDTARGSEGGGAGLGLAIAKEIIELHDGTINVASENTRTEFTLSFPASGGRDKML